VRVVTTNAFKLFKLRLKELGRIPEEGEVLDVSYDRYEYLHATNKYNVAFVNKVEIVEPAPIATEPVKTQEDFTVDEQPEVIVIKPKKTKKKETVNEN